MTDAELGQATIVYETPAGDTVEETVDNEHVAYFQDHWTVKAGEGEDGSDVVRRIPVTRVYHVERNVEAFEEEIKTLRDQVQSLATDLGGEVATLRNRIESVAGGFQRRDRDDESGERREDDAEPIEIEVGEGANATDSTTESGGTDSTGEPTATESVADGTDDETDAGDDDLDRSL